MFTISFVKPPFTSINMLLLSYGTLRVSFHSSQKCCAKWSQCQRMYFILLYLLALLGCFLCEQLSCSFVSQWKWCHTLVPATGCSHCLSLQALSNFHFHLLLHTSAGACLISQRSSSLKAAHFPTVLFYGSPEGFMPTEITLMQVFSQRKQPMGASSYRREREKSMTQRH